jgi:hypothetical protein
MEIEWDAIAAKVAQFLRCDSVAERTRIVAEEPRIRDFLAFHGLPPAASLRDAAGFSSTVFAFLIPSMTQEELAAVFQ